MLQPAGALQPYADRNPLHPCHIHIHLSIHIYICIYICICI